MTIAALYDIHGNLPALEAVLGEVDRAGAELIVIGGDVLLGPMPRQVIERLDAVRTPIRYLRGNCETALLAERAGRDPAVPDLVRVAHEWVSRQVDESHAEAIASWPLTVRLSVPPIGDVVFCHATPRHDNEIFTARTAEEKLRPIFSPLDASLCVCGHTHIQFDRMVGNTRVVNAGSVGMPFGGTGAFWLLLDEAVKLQRTAYDLTAAASRISESEYPGAAAFAQQYVMASPDVERVYELYEHAELK